MSETGIFPHETKSLLTSVIHTYQAPLCNKTNSSIPVPFMLSTQSTIKVKLRKN